MKRVMNFRLDEGEAVEWRRAANLEGRSLSNWIVAKCRAAIWPDGVALTVAATKQKTKKISKPGFSSPQTSDIAAAHTAESDRRTCLCETCSAWRKANDIPVGGLKKREKR